MIFKKIEVKDYEIQKKLFSVLFIAVITIWISIGFMFFYNRLTYSKKYIDIKYFHSNLSNNTIKRIIPASEILDGDNFIIENYLAEYVKTRETIIPRDFATKDNYIRAFTSPEILSVYFEDAERIRRINPHYLRHVYITQIVKLDDTLFQVHYQTFEKPNYKESGELKKEMIATLRYQFVDLPEYDLRHKIQNFTLLNPLKIELMVFTTAPRLS